MDLRYTDDELAFREQVRAFIKANLPPTIRQKIVEGRHPSKDDMANWTRVLNKHGWEPGAIADLQRRIAAGPGPGTAGVRRQHGRPGDLHLRVGGAEAPVPAAHRQSRRLVVPGFLR